LQQACEQGRVHRDVKPGNLMLDRSGTVKLLDLGLALLQNNPLAGSAELTSTGQLMGTVDYMAPEQAENTHEVDIRADIYSLGATLYALLTGAAPFAGAEYGSVLKKMAALANDSPKPIRDRRPDLPAELAAVVDRMVVRDPASRYATPADVAAALAPFAADANPASLLSDVATVEQVSESSVESETISHCSADSSATMADRDISFSPTIVNSELTAEPCDGSQRRNPVKLRIILASLLTVPLLAFAISQVFKPVGPDQPQQKIIAVNDVAPSPMADEALTIQPEEEDASPFGTMKREDIPPYELIVAGNGDPDTVPKELVGFFGDSRFTLNNDINNVACGPGAFAATTIVGGVAVWNLETGQITKRFTRSKGFGAGFGMVDWHEETNRIVAVDWESGCLIVDATTGDIVAPEVGKSVWHISPTAVSISKDGQFFAVGYANGNIHIRDTQTGLLTRDLSTQDSGVADLVISPNGEHLAVAYAASPNGTSAEVVLYHIADGVEISKFSHKDPSVVAYSPDGQQLAIGGYTNVSILETATGKRIREIDGRNQILGVKGIQFLNEGKRIAVAADSGTYIWDLTLNKEIGRIKGRGTSGRLDVSQDGKWVVVAGGRACQFSAFQTESIQGVTNRSFEHPWGRVDTMDLSQDGRLIAMGGRFSDSVAIWDTETGDRHSIKAGGDVTNVCFNADSTLIAVLTSYGLSVIDVASKSLLKKRTGVIQDGHGIDFIPGLGQLITASQTTGGVQFWAQDTLEPIPETEPLEKSALSLDVSRTGRQFAVSTRSGIVLRDTKSGSIVWRTMLPPTETAIHPDEMHIATMASSASGVDVHQTTSPNSVRHFKGPCNIPRSMTWNKQGAMLAAGDNHGNVVVWDHETGELLHHWRITRGDVIRSLAFSPNGRQCVVANSNRTVYVLEVQKSQQDH